MPTHPWWDVRPAINAAVPGGATHVGVVLHDVKGRRLVIAPEDKPYGVTATFPRVRIRCDESPAAALDRCLKEKAGEFGASAYPVPSCS